MNPFVLLGMRTSVIGENWTRARAGIEALAPNPSRHARAVELRSWVLR